jgi:hypothetical protein
MTEEQLKEIEKSNEVYLDKAFLIAEVRRLSEIESQVEVVRSDSQNIQLKLAQVEVRIKELETELRADQALLLIDKFYAQLQAARDALDLIAGTHGTECSSPRFTASLAIKDINESGLLK